MPKKPVNNPPAPAVNKATNPNKVSDDCEALKKKYDVNVAKYDSQKIRKKENRHHILQNATVKGLISRGAGICVALANTARGTQHQVTTKRQNKRRDNKKNGTAGAKPPKTFGALKKASKDDIKESLKKNKPKIDPKDVDALAQCLVDEAAKAVKRAAKKKRKNVTDKTGVKQTGGCFPANTQIWLDDDRRVRAALLDVGDAIEGLLGKRSVVRRDRCVNDLVRLRVGAASISLAPFHYVLVEPGRSRRADELRAGMAVLTHSGPMVLDRVDRLPREHSIHRIGMGVPFECRIGSIGLWVELPDTGPPVIAQHWLRPLPGAAREGRDGAQMDRAAPCF